MITMNNYIVTLKHDKGTFKIQVTARNKRAVIKMVMETENCPENAIIHILQIN